MTVGGNCSHEIKRCLLLGSKVMTNLGNTLKKQRYHFADKSPYSQSCWLSSRCIWMWELDHKEGWTPKNWDFQTVVLEKPLKIPLDCKEIKPVNPIGNQPWVFIGRTDAEAPILWQSALWCEELTHQKRPWCWERLRAGRGGDNRGWGGWMASLTQWTWVWAWEIVMDKEAWRATVHGVMKSRTLLNNWPPTRTYFQVNIQRWQNEREGESMLSVGEHRVLSYSGWRKGSHIGVPWGTVDCVLLCLLRKSQQMHRFSYGNWWVLMYQHKQQQAIMPSLHQMPPKKRVKS